MSFGAENRAALNKGTYGSPLPPNTQTRVAPPKWTNQIINTTAGSGTFTVPQNVYQIQATVVGGGANGCNPYLDALTNSIRFQFIPAQRYSTDITSCNNITYSPPSAGNAYAVKTDDGQYLYSDSASAYKALNLFNPSTTPTSVTPVYSGGAYVFKNGTTIIVFPKSPSQSVYICNDGIGNSGSWAGTYTTVTGNQLSAGAAFLSSSSFVGVTGTRSTYTTDSGNSWTSVTSALGNITTARGIAAGAGLYVVVGTTSTTNGGIATSTDGSTYTNRTSNSGGTTTINTVRFLNNQFIAVGGTGYLATSSDGITWTKQTTGTSATLYDVTWTGTNYVVVGDPGTILKSTNLTSWASATKESNITTAGFRAVIYANGCLFTYSYANVFNTTSNSCYGAASIDGGENWYACMWQRSFDVGSVNIWSSGVIDGKFYLFTGSTNTAQPLFISVPIMSYGGGGGGFASGIIDVVPGQKINYVVGSSGGTSSFGTGISATGGSLYNGGIGTISNTLRGALSYTGGNGGYVSIPTSITNTQKTFAIAIPGGGGGSAAYLMNGGTNSQTILAPTADILGYGGQGGAGLGSSGGDGASATSTSSGMGGGGGGYKTNGGSGLSSANGGGGGGGSLTAGLSKGTGGNGFTCTGGASAGSPNGANGGNPLNPYFLNFLDAIANDTLDGAGGGGGSTGTSTAFVGGNGSGYGGGGGGTGAGWTTATNVVGGLGSYGGGGGGGGSATVSNTSQLASGGNGGMFAGGGGAGIGADNSTVYSTINNYGGNGGIGGGGGGLAYQYNYSTTANTPTGVNINNIGYGAGTAGNAGKGGSGMLIIRWTEGY